MKVSAMSINRAFYMASYGNCTQNKSSVSNDTVFNSLKTSNNKTELVDKSTKYQNINEWKNFCQSQVLGTKLNIEA